MATALVKSGKKHQFVAWQGRHTAAISKAAGFISSDILPAGDEASNDWTVIVNFETKDQLLAWEQSDRRKEIMKEVAPLIEGDDFVDAHLIEGDRSGDRSSATEVIFSKVRPGKGDVYREWASRIQSEQAKYPGYRGAYLQPPANGDHGHWMTIIRYDTPSHLADWMSSPERAALVKESQEFIENEEFLRFTSAFPGWVPTDPLTGESPANWKTAMLVLLGLFPLVVLTMKFVNPLLGNMNASPATFIGNVLTVAATSFVTMPLFVRWFRWWLLPQKNRALMSWLGSALICLIFAVQIYALYWLFV